ncbi:hypothetical protein Vse01_43810 [Micromonospora sediminimaris]|uniref:Uncharacterized protein n=1 Tax=Micromonospora sediminimaris TaxID=547162 RepID=A0A9W5UVQ2_9ACTN|nr:hypothetical protein Vse01_43810 [Micromonospora sediminimaris]
MTAAVLVGGITLAVLLGATGLGGPAAADGPGAAIDAYELTTGRFVSLVGALAALAGVVIGGLALSRPSSRIGTRRGRLGATIALMAGLVGMALGGYVVAAAKGGPGTGYGIVGGVMALVMGLIAVALGGLALARYRRTGRLSS